MIGVLLNQILPDPLILICLLLVLTIALYRMVKKGRSQWKKENEEKARVSAMSVTAATVNEAVDERSTSTTANRTSYHSLSLSFSFSIVCALWILMLFGK